MRVCHLSVCKCADLLAEDDTLTSLGWECGVGWGVFEVWGWGVLYVEAE